MCGIVGAISKQSGGLLKQHEDTFMQLLYADVVRGDDSTGIIGVEKDSSFHIAKESTQAAWFQAVFDNSEIYKSMWKNGKAYIGHNRKSTVGLTNDTNAHPFVINDEFAMVHNGTLYNHKTLANTEVDSEALATVLAKAFEETDYMASLEETLGRVHGAYALAMYDQRHHAVRLLRNKERPLAYAETPNGWFFASEGAMLFWIMSRNGYDMSKVKIVTVPEHTLLSFDLDTNQMTSEEVVPKKPIPPVTTTRIHTGGKTTTKPTPTSLEGMSKNAYKRFRRKLLNKRIEWWVEDYIETNFPLSEKDGETLFNLMGVCDDLMDDHIIMCKVDIKKLNLLSNELIDRLWYGEVTDISYDTKTKVVSIVVENSLPLPVSIRKEKLELIDAEYIRRKLDEAEKTIPVVH